MALYWRAYAPSADPPANQAGTPDTNRPTLKYHRLWCPVDNFPLSWTRVCLRNLADEVTLTRLQHAQSLGAPSHVAVREHAEGHLETEKEGNLLEVEELLAAGRKRLAAALASGRLTTVSTVSWDGW